MKLDHYAILGLPSGVAGAKLSQQQIIKAYKLKALKLHPDKRRNDPNAHKNFQRLQNSYDILKDNKTRKDYDDLVRVEHEKFLQELKMAELKKKESAEKKARDEEEKFLREFKMMKELAEKKAREEKEKFLRELKMKKELAEKKVRDEEERIAKKLKAEIAKIRDMHANTMSKGAATTGVKDGQFGFGKENMLEVSWDNVGDYYSAQRLRELFEEFGEVLHVVIRSWKINKGSALIVMASKAAAIAATKSVIGDPSNRLLVLPILQPSAVVFPIDQKYYVQSQSPELSTSSVDTGGYQAYEASVFAKLRRTEEGLLKGKKRKLDDNDDISKHL